MLLDEPTNHLDIRAIGWLEEQLAATTSAFVIISHDRAVLRNVARATLWVDRGQVRRQDKGFDAFEGWRDKTWEEEDLARHKLKRLIKSEARWAVEGISARRKRNQGRVRALQGLRAEQAAQITRQGAAAMDLSVGKKSGKKVIEAGGPGQKFRGPADSPRLLDQDRAWRSDCLCRAERCWQNDPAKDADRRGCAGRRDRHPGR